jgi:hypothetical protein
MPQRTATNAGHTLKAATGCARSGLTDWSPKTGHVRGNSDGLRGQGESDYLTDSPAQDASFWGLAHERVLTHTAP